LKTADSVHVLLLDTLNMEVVDQAFVRDQMMQCLANAQPGARLEYPGYYRTSEGKGKLLVLHATGWPKEKAGPDCGPAFDSNGLAIVLLLERQVQGHLD
jgi:hypothetical protein